MDKRHKYWQMEKLRDYIWIWFIDWWWYSVVQVQTGLRCWT